MAGQILKRHPIRGFLYGILFGLGLAMVAIGQGWAALGTWSSFIVFLVGLVVATLWGMFGPAKRPKGPPPEEPAPKERVESSRFDDFDAPDAPADTATDDAGADTDAGDAPGDTSDD